MSETNVKNERSEFLYVSDGEVINIESIDNYIGIPHVFNGDTYDGCDCIGLCRLFYCEHGWVQDFKDGKEITEDWQKRDRGRLIRYLRKYFKVTRKPDALSFGDIVLFCINSDYHVGIYLEYGNILAMQVPCKEGVTASTLYKKHFWKPYFKRAYMR